MDLIDRQALMDELEIPMRCDDCQYRDTIRKGHCTMPSEFFNACVAITDAPSVEPKKGEWSEVTIPWPPDYLIYKCSECGGIEVFRIRFCPHCGAEMRGAGYESFYE